MTAGLEGKAGRKSEIVLRIERIREKENAIRRRRGVLQKMIGPRYGERTERGGRYLVLKLSKLKWDV